MNQNPKGGFFIGITCPGCGGALELQSDFFVLQCGHCGSVLRVVMPDTPPAFVVAPKKSAREIRFLADRHLKGKGQPLSRPEVPVRQFYYPYWKIEAIQFKVREPRPIIAPERESFLTAELDYNDHSLAAIGMGSSSGGRDSDIAVRDGSKEVTLSPFLCTRPGGPDISGIPFSLGLRTEYVKLSPYSKEAVDEDADYFPVTRSWAETLAGLDKPVVFSSGGGAAAGYRPGKLFRPDVAVVYFPYYAVASDSCWYLVDGLSGRIVADSFPIDQIETPDSGSGLAFGELTVEFHRCSNCGVDLPAKQSFIYTCHNCRSVNSLEHGISLEEKVQVVRSDHDASDSLFPFWLLRIDPEQAAVIAKHPAGMKTSEWVVVPAFKIANFNIARRLCRNMTAAFPDISTVSAEPNEGECKPVDSGLTEARTIAEICLFCEMTAKTSREVSVPETIRPHEVGLLYMPFRLQSYCYVDSALGAVTFPQKALAR